MRVLYTILMSFVLFGTLPQHVYATFSAGPLVSCMPAHVFDAGYTFQVTAGADSNTFDGELISINHGQNKSLGKERIKVEQDYSSGTCGLRVTQINDRDSNGLKLTIKRGKGISYEGNLFVKLKGRAIPEMLRDVSCYVDQFTYNQICKPNYGGAVYESQGSDDRSGSASQAD